MDIRQTQVEHAELQRWQRFYADRTRPCPFFIDAPDENLVAWVEGGPIRPGTALDIGCGNGRNTGYLARRGFDAQGVDVSGHAIAWATERAAARGEPAGFVCGSIFEQPLQPARHDLVYDAGCFHHLAPHQRLPYAQLVTRALRPGGHFGLVCFAPEGGSGWTDDEVYERGSVCGGLGYTAEALADFWGTHLEVLQLRRMNEQPDGADSFGKPFLWVMLARAR